MPLQKRWPNLPFALAAALFIFVTLFFSPALRAAEAPRQWIDRTGRSIVATLITANEEHCTLRDANGRISTVSTADLDEEGVKYIRAWLSARREGGATVAPVIGPWPHAASAGKNSEVTAVERTSAAGAHVYRSSHFEFRSDISLLSGTVKEFADIFEATLAALQAIPAGLAPDPPVGRYPVELYLDKNSFYGAGAPKDAAGYYNGYTGKLLISLGDLGFTVEDQRLRLDYRRNLYVLKHEATHQVMGPWLGRMPVWLSEGWAEYIAAIPYDSGTYRFNNITESTKTYVNRWRKDEDQRRIPVHHPKRLMALTFSQWTRELEPESAILNYNSAGLLVTYFMHLDGDGRGSNMAAYLNSVRTARNHIELRHRVHEAVNEFFLRGRTHDQLAADLAAAWRKHGIILMIGKE